MSCTCNGNFLSLKSTSSWVMKPTPVWGDGRRRNQEGPRRWTQEAEGRHSPERLWNRKGPSPPPPPTIPHSVSSYTLHPIVTSSLCPIPPPYLKTELNGAPCLCLPLHPPNPPAVPFQTKTKSLSSFFTKFMNYNLLPVWRLGLLCYY